MAKSTESTATSSKPTETHVLHSTSAKAISSFVILATAQVTVISKNEELSHARALIDQGSEISLISERLVQRLMLPRKKNLPFINWYRSSEVRQDSRHFLF